MKESSPGYIFTEKKYSDQDLIAFMVKFAKENGRSPTENDFRDLSKKGLGPSDRPYFERGGWNLFLIKAGLELNLSSSPSVDELSKPEYFRQTKKYLLENPNATEEDIDKDFKKGICPSISTFRALGGLPYLRQYFGIQKEGKGIHFNEKETIFLDSLISGKSAREAAIAAGFKGAPVSQLTIRFNVRTISDVLAIYKKHKEDKTL
jgi:hypothetical protein